MPYEPLVLLHRLAPEDVNQLIRPNQSLPPVVNQQQQNVQRCQNDEEGSAQSSEKDVLVVCDSAAGIERQQQIAEGSSPTVQVSTANPNGTKHDDRSGDTFSEKQDNKLNSFCELSAEKAKIVSLENVFIKELFVVIDNCCDGMFIDMVNSTAQHPKTRNSTSSAIGVNSNNNSASGNSAASSRDPTLAKDHITDETNLIMTSKSPLPAITPVIEAIDKKTKEVLINNHLTSDEHNSSGLSLRTRTISSTTAPGPFHQSIVSSSNSVQLNCSTVAVNGRRPRGRRPKTLHRADSGKPLQHANIKKSDESKVCNSNYILTKEEPSTSGLERLQQKQSLNYCNGTTKYNDKQDNSNKTLSDNVVNKHFTLIPGIDKTKESIVGSMCNKKYNYRKRKPCDNEDPVAEKRFLVSDGLDDSLEVQKNPIVTSSLPDIIDKVEITFGFLQDHATRSNNYQRPADRSFTPYGRTYWPVNWEYSAAALTGHVHKKVTKDELRKIRQISSIEANNKTENLVSLKSNSNLKKSQTSLVQRRRSTNRLAASSVEMPSCSKQHTPTTSNVVKRKKPGRPPGKNNKLLQRVIKSNSPRKSPRQHASTLAAIKSNKVLDNGDKLELPQSDKIINVDGESDKKPLDIDRPCVLPIAVSKGELKLSERHKRHRRQLDHQRSFLVDRRLKRRSVTPPPPKLSAQQPVSQRTCINSASVDQEIKLRTKNVDVVRRRARDERLRSIFVCQQIQKLRKVSEQVRQDYVLDYDDCPSSMKPLPLHIDQSQIWLSLTANGHQELNNMCLQIMYEQTCDIRFLLNHLTKETLQTYKQQRELALAECINNNYGDNVCSDLGADMIIVGNKRKKKRPNMTGWPKEKRRKTIATASSSIADVETPHNYDRILERRRKAAEQQRLRRQRIKLEQQQLAKEKSKLVTATIRKRPGRRPGLKKKNRTVKFARRTTSVSSNATIQSSDTNSSVIKTKRRGRKKNPFLNKRKNCKSIQGEKKITLSVPKATVVPEVVSKTIVKRKLGRPKGSMGHRKKMRLEKLQRARNQTSLSSDQQKENVVQQQVSSGKLKCVISTRNNRVKLLSSKKSFASSNRKKANGTKIKKSTGVCNTSSSNMVVLPSATFVGKSARITARKKRLQQLEQMTSTSTTWDVGRPKRYQSANHGRVVATEEDCCFVGSQPFEQHCPNGEVGLSQNTVIDNKETHQKESSIHESL